MNTPKIRFDLAPAEGLNPVRDIDPNEPERRKAEKKADHDTGAERVGTL